MGSNRSEYSSSNINAQKLSNHEADRILSNPELTTEIVAAYRELGTARKVTELLGEKLGMPVECSTKTKMNTILLVVAEHIPSEELAQVRQQARDKMRTTIIDKTVAKKMETGSQIFDEERTNYLMELDRNTPTFRGRFAQIAAAMNERFEVTVFTSKNCSKKTANVKRAQKLHGQATA